jgi:phosphatidylglycerophosphate synthase
MRVESRLRVDRDRLFFIASYGITFFRLGVAFFAASNILRAGNLWFSVSSIAFIIAADYFDGAVFAKSDFNHSKIWRVRRRLFDSVIDRFVIQIVCIALALTNSAFVWLYVPIAAREVIISGYLSKAFAERLVVYPRSISKIACAMVGVAVMSFLLMPPAFTLITTAIMVSLSSFALIDYVRRANTYKASSPESQDASLQEVF